MKQMQSHTVGKEERGPRSKLLRPHLPAPPKHVPKSILGRGQNPLQSFTIMCLKYFYKHYNPQKYYEECHSLVLQGQFPNMHLNEFLNTWIWNKTRWLSGRNPFKLYFADLKSKYQTLLFVYLRGQFLTSLSRHISLVIVYNIILFTFSVFISMRNNSNFKFYLLFVSLHQIVNSVRVHITLSFTHNA